SIEKNWLRFASYTTIDCFRVLSYQQGREPLALAAQQRRARNGRACAVLAGPVGRLQPIGQALVTTLSRGEGVALIFEIPAFLRERIPRLLRRGSKRPSTHLPIGFVLTILLAIRKIDLYLYLCVRFDAAKKVFGSRVAFVRQQFARIC